MFMFVDSHADQDASVPLTCGLVLASEHLAPPVEPRSIESMSPEQLRDRIAWLEAEVAALRMVCPSEHRPDPREALLPAEFDNPRRGSPPVAALPEPEWYTEREADGKADDDGGAR